MEADVVEGGHGRPEVDAHAGEPRVEQLRVAAIDGIPGGERARERGHEEQGGKPEPRSHDVGSLRGPSTWTKRQPKRPFTHRLPSVIELSCGELAFTIRPSCTCSRSVQPTPQNGQIVSVIVCSGSFQRPSARRSNS